jgi:hypothetical protein
MEHEPKSNGLTVHVQGGQAHTRIIPETGSESVTKGFEKEILTIESLITSQRMCRSCDPSNVLGCEWKSKKGKAG